MSKFKHTSCSLYVFSHYYLHIFFKHVAAKSEQKLKQAYFAHAVSVAVVQCQAAVCT